MSTRKTTQAKAEEKEIRDFVKALRLIGVDVRRENLSRGVSYRVKSGDCRLDDSDIFFVDKRIPAEQQRVLLTEYVAESGIEFPEDEQIQRLISDRLRRSLYSEAA